MVESAMIRAFQRLNLDPSTRRNENCILEYLRKTQNEEFVTKVFTNAANCMKTGEDKFESILSLVSFAVNVFSVPYMGTVVNVFKFIYSIFINIRGGSGTFSIMTENLRSELSKKMEDIENDLQGFCACFDARFDDLDIEEEREERALRLLHDVSYKEIRMDLTGKLEAIISRHKNVREEEVLHFVAKVLNVYIRVAIMRYILQVSILSFMPDEKMQSATNYMKKYMEKDIDRRINFLTRILEPSHENAIFLSFFSIREIPQLEMFLKIKGSTTEEQPFLRKIGAFLTKKSIALHPVVFRGHWMNSAAIKYVWSTSTTPHVDYAQYCFESVSEGENIFFIKSHKRQTYIYMKPDFYLYQMRNQPREEGMFKVLRLQNNSCLISVLKYPGKFIYMQNKDIGWIKGAVKDDTYNDGRPTEQHEWSLMEVCHRRNGDKINFGENPKTISVFLP